MSSNSTVWLVLRLEGPLQSWGFEDRFNHRKTGLLPTKSAVFGLCCAALGAARGSELEREWLMRLSALEDFVVVALPRGNAKKSFPVRRMQDYQTVQNSRTADGKIKDTHITHRTYLNDANFAVIFQGQGEDLAHVAAALKDPVWGLWLGRKACIPSAPVFRGLFPTEQEALNEALGEKGSLRDFTYQRDAGDFGDGTDTLMDLPISFADPRQFVPRRVRLHRNGTRVD